MSLIRRLLLTLIYIQREALSIDIRIHSGLLDFEYNSISDPSVNSSLKPYTFEVFLNDTAEMDYTITNCSLNNCQFFTRFGCVKDNTCILRGLESDSYNRKNAKKQSLVHFYATSDSDSIECEIMNMRCSGCAERSCYRHFDASLYQSDTVLYSCYRENETFFCESRKKGNNSRDSKDYTRDTEGIVLDVFEASIYSDLVNKYSWVLVLFLIILFTCISVIFIYCYRCSCFTIIDAQGNDLNYAAYKRELRRKKLEAVEKIVIEDKEFEERIIELPKAEFRAQNLIRASTFVQHDETRNDEIFVLKHQEGIIARNSKNDACLVVTEIIDRIRTDIVQESEDSIQEKEDSNIDRKGTDVIKRDTSHPEKNRLQVVNCVGTEIVEQKNATVVSGFAASNLLNMSTETVRRNRRNIVKRTREKKTSENINNDPVEKKKNAQKKEKKLMYRMRNNSTDSQSDHESTSVSTHDETVSLESSIV